MKTFQPEDFLRPHIQQMPPYLPIHPMDVLSEDLGIPEYQLVKLDANENPYGPLPEVNSALGELSNLELYPDPESRYLRRDLARLHDVPVERILAGAGADELIDLILRAALNPGDGILNCPPTFGMYAFDAGVHNVRVVNISRDREFSLNLPGIRAAVEEMGTRVLFLASPNNPDGSILPRDVLLSLLELPLLVVVDEAYIDFSPPGSSALSLTADYPNLIVLRTFSKWAGLAGLRVGYGIFPDWMMTALWKIKQPYNVNAAAAAAARVTLENQEKLVRQTVAILEERACLREKLDQIDWLRTYPTEANFILCQVSGKDAGEVKEKLAKQGILIRYFKKPGLEDHIRISVGRSGDTDVLITALSQL